jgi:uncharacterized protein (DUF983 family)
MTAYNYVCPSCGHKYNEIRTESEPQYFTKCNAGCDIDYVEESNDEG